MRRSLVTISLVASAAVFAAVMAVAGLLRTRLDAEVGDWACVAFAQMPALWLAYLCSATLAERGPYGMRTLLHDLGGGHSRVGAAFAFFAARVVLSVLIKDAEYARVGT